MQLRVQSLLSLFLFCARLTGFCNGVVCKLQTPVLLGLLKRMATTEPTLYPQVTSDFPAKFRK